MAESRHASHPNRIQLELLWGIPTRFPNSWICTAKDKSLRLDEKKLCFAQVVPPTCDHIPLASYNLSRTAEAKLAVIIFGRPWYYHPAIPPKNVTESTFPYREAIHSRLGGRLRPAKLPQNCGGGQLFPVVSKVGPEEFRKHSRVAMSFPFSRHSSDIAKDGGEKIKKHSLQPTVYRSRVTHVLVPWTSVKATFKAGSFFFPALLPTLIWSGHCRQLAPNWLARSSQLNMAATCGQLNIQGLQGHRTTKNEQSTSI